MTMSKLRARDQAVLRERLEREALPDNLSGRGAVPDESLVVRDRSAVSGMKSNTDKTADRT